jgi:hypothetical protein
MNKSGAKKWLWTGLLAAALIAFLLSPHASQSPDGLDRVAIDHGFKAQEKQALWSTPLSGYELKWIGKSALSTGVAGLAGVLLTFGAALLVGKLLASRKRSND